MKNRFPSGTARMSERGRLIAIVLAGAWRSSPPPLDFSAATLEQITPIILRKGSAGLGWWRIRHSKMRTLPAALQLRNTYRLYTLYMALRERKIVQAFKYLRAAGVEPLLAKGWAAGQLYPERGLRPYGDLDLCVQPQQYSTALAALRSPDAPECAIELHNGFREFPDRCAQQLFERSRLVLLQDTKIRILGPEDHLRLLCLHALHHGVWRPLWLCDIAAGMESVSREFDWELCMSGDSWSSDGVRCAFGVAHELLGVSLDAVPAAFKPKSLPRWLIPATLREWGTREHYMTSRGMGEYLWQSRGVIRALRLRWPNPIRATSTVRAPLNELPRLPFQLAECFLRSVRFACRLPEALRIPSQETKL